MQQKNYLQFLRNIYIPSTYKHDHFQNIGWLTPPNFAQSRGSLEYDLITRRENSICTGRALKSFLRIPYIYNSIHMIAKLCASALNHPMKRLDQ